MIPVGIRSLVKALVLPPAGPLLVTFVGIAMLGRHPRRGRAIALTGLLLLLLLSMPGIAALLVRGLDRSPPLDPARAAGAQAIIILGGGMRAACAGIRRLDARDAHPRARALRCARRARITGLPVLVSGGAIGRRPIEALLMRNALVQEFGVPVRWMETRSHDTHENALFSAAMLKASGVTRVILVAHSFDIPRVTAEFDALRAST